MRSTTFGSSPSLPPPGEPSERDGPLNVERHRKADGRPLILYRWVGEDG
jgi:hypothetical protein